MRTRTMGTLAAAAVPLLTPLLARAAEASVDPEQPGLLSPQLSSAIWVVVIFLILVAILYKTAWKNVLAGLNAREARIRRDIADADAARNKAEGSLVEYNKQLATAEGQVRELLNKAALDAERIATGIKQKAQADAEATRDRMTKEIEAAQQRALAEIYEQAATLATSVAAKILGREINADDQKKLVEDSLKQMQTAGA